MGDKSKIEWTDATLEPCPRRLDVDLFRGVNKVYLEQYVIIFQWYYNLKTVTDEFLRVLLGCTGTTKLVT